jgi:hypothetical protein
MCLSGATLGATGTNDLPEIRTKMNSGREHPRPRTVLNGSGCPHMELRI